MAIDREKVDGQAGGDSAARSRSLEDLVAAYLDRLQNGERLDKTEILASHPELGPAVITELETFLDPDRARSAGAAAFSDGDPVLGVLGDYQLLRRVGRGGMGVVYEAWQNSMDRRVALKVLPAGVAADTKAVTRFIREARIAGKLLHPNVVSVYGTGVEAETPYYAMEFVLHSKEYVNLRNTRTA